MELLSKLCKLFHDSARFCAIVVVTSMAFDGGKPVSMLNIMSDKLDFKNTKYKPNGYFFHSEQKTKRNYIKSLC